MDSFTKACLEILQAYIDEHYHGNVMAAQEGLGLGTSNTILHRWLKALNGTKGQSRIPKLDSIGPVLEKLGVKVLSNKDWNDLRAGQKIAPAACDSEQVEELKRQVAELLQYKYKWEAVLELNGQKPSLPSQKKDLSA